jgi:hypothetical protein
MKNILSVTIMAFGLLGCVSSSPYVEKNISRVVPEATVSAFTASDGVVYNAKTYIEVFRPGYFIVIGRNDKADTSKEFKSVSNAAIEVIQQHDCKRKFVVWTDKSQYDAGSKRWLISGDCGRGLQ